MEALLFNITLNSLYSIRLPFTWQSALTYPILPPSAVIGLCANALQRLMNDRDPREYLQKLEEHIIWGGSRLLTPCVVKSYTTSAIVKWEDAIDGKFTNALTRQFAFSRNLECVVILKNSELTSDIKKALKNCPLTCGDSESPITIENEPEICQVKELSNTNCIETCFPLPFYQSIEIVDGKGQIFLMHENCLKKGEKFPLKSYIVPIDEKNKILSPTFVKIKLMGDEIKILQIVEKGINLIVSNNKD